MTRGGSGIRTGDKVFVGVTEITVGEGAPGESRSAGAGVFDDNGEDVNWEVACGVLAGKLHADRTQIRTRNSSFLNLTFFSRSKTSE